MTPRGVLAAAASASALLLAVSLGGQTVPTPSPVPKASHPPGKRRPARPAVDFTGIWELDLKASRNVSKAMEGAVLSVKQNGNRIWMEPIEQTAPRLLAEQIVVDGQQYEKRIGRQKGTVVAEWGKDGTSLWLQATASTDVDPQAVFERMVWRLQDFGNTWTRQSWASQGDKVKQTYLVFRKRGAKPNPTVSPGPTPKR